MGTTAEKLNYLKETKSEIKNALETPSNIFRDYPSLIKKYIDNQPTNTVSDGNCTNALDVPLVSLRVDGNSYQAENPSPEYPQEIETINSIGLEQSGKNKLDFKKILENANAVYTERDGVFNLTNQGKLYSAPYKLNLKPNTTYTIYQNFQEQNSTNVRLSIVRGSNYERVVESYSTSEAESYRKKTFTTDESSDYYIRGDWSLLYSPLIYNEPILVEGTDVIPYEPYHEPIITPINLQGNTLGKVGDVKDILKVNRNGEVEIKKNIEKIVLTGSEKLVEKSSSTTRTYWGIDFSNYGIYQYDDSTKTCDILTTKFKSRPQQGSFLPGQVALMTGKKNVYFIFEPDTTEEQARAILTDMPVYFRLAEPQTIKLSSISPIELWQGTNIFKLITNLDTTFEVEYVVNKDSVLNEVQTAMLEAEIEI